MRKKLTITFLLFVCVCACTFGLSACGLFGDKGGSKKCCAVFHFNGGYFNKDDGYGEEYSYTLYNGETFDPGKAKKDTWIFDNWYFDEGLTEKYSDNRFEELRKTRENIDLYANYIDEVTVDKNNFKEYFSVYSRWNGGGSIGTAGITYSITPKFVYDPANSAESIEVEINPVLTRNYEVVWDGGKSTVALTPENDYSVSGVKAIDSSGAGIRFDIMGNTLNYELKTQPFNIKLFHNVPVNIALELNGGECEKEALTVTGCEQLLKSALPTPQKSGCRFLGWFKDAEFEKEYTDWVVTRPVTLYAKFVKEITVTYHMNGAAEKEPEKFLVTENLITYDSPSREGYKFSGYYTTPTFEENSRFYSGDKSDKDIDLYARWEAIRTITFETNGGSEKESIEVVNGETPYLGTDPTKDSLRFYGWFTDEEFTKPYEEAPINDDITLYALWVEEKRLMGNIESLKEYVDIQLTDEKIDGVLTLTLNLSIKEKYRAYDFVLNGRWGVELYNENGSCGVGHFAAANGMNLSTENGKPTATGVYTAQKGYANNNATIFELYVNNFFGCIYIPEGTVID